MNIKHNIGRVILLVITGILLASFLAGCYTPGKAVDQMNKAYSRYPDTVAAFTRDKFPCVPLNIDSSAFIKSLATLDSLLDNSRDNLVATQERLAYIRDSILLAVDQTLPCNDNLNMALDELANTRLENERLANQHNKDVSTINQVRAQLKNVKPVLKIIEDSAKIFLALQAKGRAETLYNIDHAWRLDREAKDKGKFVIRIPKLIVFLLLAVVGLLVFMKLKFGFLNPLNLLKRKT